jgi:hypothetical protein
VEVYSMRPTLKLAALLAAAALAALPVRLSAADFPFRLSPLTEGAIGASALGLYGSSIYFDSIKKAPDASAVNAGNIPFFDLLYETSHSAGMGTAADGLMIATALVPGALLPGRSGKELLTGAAM